YVTYRRPAEQPSDRTGISERVTVPPTPVTSKKRRPSISTGASRTAYLSGGPGVGRSAGRTAADDRLRPVRAPGKADTARTSHELPDESPRDAPRPHRR